jgi:phosphatidate cytidylyltransferase
MQYQKSFTLFEIFILNNVEFSYILIILFISAVSQIGDLIVSYFKRLAKIKNTGNLLPGHGGLLDRIDGIIFAIPISYLLFMYLK